MNNGEMLHRTLSIPFKLSGLLLESICFLLLERWLCSSQIVASITDCKASAKGVLYPLRQGKDLELMTLK